MRRTVATVAVMGITIAGVGSAAAAKKKAEKADEPKPPIQVTVENGCAQALDLKLGNLPIQVDANGKSGPHLVPADAEDYIYELSLLAPKPVQLARLSIAPGTRYHVRVAECAGGAANVYTRNETVAPPSPHAAARVRFRARQNLYLEYKLGKTGRFLPLSIAMTRYTEQKAGDVEFTLRLRAARNGPVLSMLRKTVKVEPGHQYLIEANVVGRQILFSKEDEGLAQGG